MAKWKKSIQSEVSSEQKGPNLMEAAQNTDFYKNKTEKEGLVRMKCNNHEYPGTGLGVSDTTFLLAASAQIKWPDLGYNPGRKDHSILTQQHDGTWKATPASEKPGLPSGMPKDGMKYIFIRMQDGTIRISGDDRGGTNGHANLSGWSAYVRYAGEIWFKDGKAVSGRGESGSYLPPREKWNELSGFDCESR